MSASTAIPFIIQQAGLSATPLLFAGFGELIAQRAGVINVGIEGVMLTAAFAAFAAAVITGTSTAALPAAILAAMLIAALFALVAVWFRADQIVAGTAINILAAGLTTAGSRLLDDNTPAHPTPALFEPVQLSGTFLPVWFARPLEQYPLFYAAIPATLLLLFLMKRTRFGLVVRGLGDSPDACNAAGINVRLTRTLLILLAGAAAGLAGAYLSTMRSHGFQLNMTAGRGFLVLALVIFGRWNLLGFIAGVLAFSLLDGLRIHLQSEKSLGTFAHMLEMLPYLATLAALAIMSKSRAGPIHLARSWPE